VKSKREKLGDLVTNYFDRSANIPVAPIAKLEDLFNNPQLNAGGSLSETILPDGIVTKLPKLPVELSDAQFDLTHNSPKIEADTVEVLRGELSKNEIKALRLDKVVTS
jgi:crotonobetainyl-CoA:carnitine CoA-transferase CaiB-like acyl-CoA transferase